MRVNGLIIDDLKEINVKPCDWKKSDKAGETIAGGFKEWHFSTTTKRGEPLFDITQELRNIIKGAANNE